MPSPKLYLERRQRLAAQINQAQVCLIIGSGQQAQRNADVFFPTRVNSNFYYLTGCDHPGCLCVLWVEDGIMSTWLFAPPYDAHKALWDGDSQSPDQLSAQHHIDCLSINDFSAWLSKKVKASTQILATGIKSDASWIKNHSVVYEDSHLLTTLGRLRQIKDSHEQACLRQACQRGQKAFEITMQQSLKQSFDNERLIAAEYRYQCQRMGEGDFSFPCIAAGGARATVLHYQKNNQALMPNDRVLLDAGCEVGYYASDITRCWPLSGKFEGAYLDVYQAVLDCQEAIIAELKPSVSWLDLEKKARHQLIESLRSLNLQDMSFEAILSNQDFKTFYPHSLGHHLGLDVHDLSGCSRGQDFKLLPGMCLTIEPGLYFPAIDASKHYAGIGVRIEDDCLITDTGVEVLTAELPKKVADVEAMLAE